MTKTKIAFTKMNGAGNDFVVIDDRKKMVGARGATVAKALCPRRFGVGSDGMILIRGSRKKNASFSMIFYNPDGSRASTCGNGARCAASFAYNHRIVEKNMTFETDAGLYKAVIADDRVILGMSDPAADPVKFDLYADQKVRQVHFVDTGVPHAVLIVDDIEAVDVAGLGRAIRMHKHFKPHGTNVNFVQVTDNAVHIRTFERGVEDETLACGTGAVASALCLAGAGMVESPVLLHAKGGNLEVEFTRLDGNYRSITLTGPAVSVFTGIAQV